MFDSEERSAREAESHDENSHGDGKVMGFPTRYRDKAMSWIALGALLAAWHMPVRVDRAKEELAQSRVPALRSAHQRGPEQPWVTRASEVRSWMTRAPHGVTRTRSQQRFTAPDWSAIASVRMARRWLDSL
jgi:hypothetical protein